MPEVRSAVYDAAGLRLPDTEGVEEGEGEPTLADPELSGEAGRRGPKRACYGTRRRVGQCFEGFHVQLLLVIRFRSRLGIREAPPHQFRSRLAATC